MNHLSAHTSSGGWATREQGQVLPRTDSQLGYPSTGFEDEVQFISKSPYRWHAADHSRALLLFAYLFVMFGWGKLNGWMCAQLGFTTMSEIAIFSLPIASWFAILLLHRRRRKAKVANMVGGHAPISRRIACVAAPEWLSPWNRDESNLLEPEIFPSLDLLDNSWTAGPRLALFYFGFLSAASGLSELTGGSWFRPSALAICGAILAAFILERVLLWPSYLRISPGRLDVLRFNNFPGGKTVTKSIPLSTAHLLIDLHKHSALITASGESTEVPFVLVRGRRRFAHCLIRAALSTHPSPPLPEDELLG